MAKKGSKKSTAATAPDACQEPPPAETLGELAEAVASGEAVPGGELTEQEIAQLKPGDVLDVDLTVHRAEPSPPEVPRGTEGDPAEALRKIVQGTLHPRWVGVTVAGAPVSFCYREKKWRDAIALRADVDADGKVLIDLETDNHQAVLAVSFGDKVRCWKFRAE